MLLECDVSTVRIYSRQGRCSEKVDGKSTVDTSAPEGLAIWTLRALLPPCKPGKPDILLGDIRSDRDAVKWQAVAAFLNADPNQPPTIDKLDYILGNDESPNPAVGDKGARTALFEEAKSLVNEIKTRPQKRKGV